MRTMVLAAAVLLLGTADVMAQATEYRRTPGTVLRYRETRQDEIERVQSYGGDAHFKTEQEAVFNVRFVAGDTAVAWYDELSEAIVPNTGLVRTRNLLHRLGKRHVLRFPANGNVVVVAGPNSDPEALYSDLRADWPTRFLSLPNDPLEVGDEWSSRASGARQTMLGEDGSVNFEMQMRVTGERVVNGMKALVIEVRETSTSVSGVNTYSPFRMEVEGKATGTVLFAPAEGLLLERTVTGDTRVNLRMNDGTPLSSNTLNKFTIRQQLIR